MIDGEVRRALAPLWDRGARVCERVGLTPTALTVTGLVIALAASAAAAVAAWPWALALWLASRIPDGLDGPLARRTGTSTAFGGWADIVADMAAYGAFVAGCAIGNPDARLACVVLLLTYYVNGASFLALSAAVEARRTQRPDERTFHFRRAFAEGTETIVVHALMVLLPALMAPIAWGFAALVLATTLQRTRDAHRTLS